MNRPIIITTGILILLIVLGVWIYILFFGTPTSSQEVFTNLGFQLGTQGTTITPPSDSTPIENLVDTNTGTLRQLTTREVAGYVSTTTANAEIIRYVEKGTGHIFDINLQTGVETILSNTTLPKIAVAIWNKTADAVALITYDNYYQNVTVGVLKNGLLETTALETNAKNIAFDAQGNVLYTVISNGSTIGYSQNLTTGTRTAVFSAPLIDVVVDWKQTLHPTYVTTSYSEALAGYTYEPTNTGSLQSVLGPFTGLQTEFINTVMLLSSLENNTYRSRLLGVNDNTLELPFLALREKCTFFTIDENTLLTCAAPIDKPTSGSAEEWYRGAYAFSDMFWLVNSKTGITQLLSDPLTEVGRTLDAIDVQMSEEARGIGFINKTDNTLWVLSLEDISITL